MRPDSSQTGFADAIDYCIEVLGRLTAWAALGLVLTQAVVVLLRYVFGVGFIWMQDSVLYLHSILFLGGAGYCLLHDGHVRVDVFLERASPRVRALVDIGTALFLILPLCAIITYYSWDYVSNSWVILEGAREASGLPYTYLLKSLILGFCNLLGLQAISLLIRGFYRLREAPA